MEDRKWVRNSVVSGLFYPDNPLHLRTAVERLLIREKELKRVSFLLVPHAGYLYSGSTAGKTFACSDISERAIILGPNHTGIGKPISVWSRGCWKTPLGDVKIDEEAAGILLSLIGKEYEDRDGHLREHSIEVELPFMQVRYEKIKIVPICVGTEKYAELVELGEGIAKVSKRFNNNLTIIVSSDMNHYESAEMNREKDEAALNEIINLNAEALFKVVNEKKISMCGYSPCVAAIFALKQLGENKIEVVDYTHSGVISGDYDEVVSYAGARCIKED
ncbi:MAG: AmmeMemoRadiSam system protein B [Acidobacteria bacterium]|nr:AmmeMemoRadiSam system protein B [Acidobacteriota bacterium]